MGEIKITNHSGQTVYVSTNDDAVDRHEVQNGEFAVIRTNDAATGYPQTKMSPGDLGAQLVHAMVGAPDTYDFSLHSMDRLTGFANAILKRAVDDGTVPSKEAYEQCSRDLLEAENLLESLGYRRTHEGEWEAPMPETQFQRDMKVAEAVRGWYQRQYPDVAMRIVQPDLEHIIRGVK